MQYIFGPFCLDTATQQIWRDTQLLLLRPRPFAVLRCLVAQAGEVVESAALLKAVWGPTQVGRAALEVCIRAIREALTDEAAIPRYLETVGRIGYRLIAPVTVLASPDLASSESALAQWEKQTTTPAPTLPVRSSMVGREAELAHLQKRLAKARTGARQLVFVTGEAGIGKTTLVDGWLQTLDTAMRIGRGQCLEQYGEGEAYLPVLEALGQLCRGVEGNEVLAVLRRIAPTWLVQLPRWLHEEEVAAVQGQAQGATPARMLREMAEALEVLATQHLVVLVLEDLHWSDRSTLDLLAYLAQRREQAQLYILGTYRSAEADITEPSLARLTDTLRTRGQGMEVKLAGLSAAEVRNYVQRRFPRQAQSEELARWLHRRSEGNALFLVTLADHYAQEERMDEEVVPATLQQLIAHQVTRLTPMQQQVLEGASVAGMEFGSTVVAAGVGIEPETVDEVCAELSYSGQWVQTAGVLEWPDSTLSIRCRFRHALYPQVVYERLPELRRRRLHQRMGRRLEAGYRAQARERAAELAWHFECAGTVEKALQYYQLAGENALQRSAHQEAVLQLTKGLAATERLAPSPARLTHELRLQTLLPPALMAIKGHTAAEVEETFLRARELCEHSGDTQRLFFILLGLFRLHNARGAYRQAADYAKACLTLAAQQRDTTLLLGAHYAAGANAFYLGELAEAQTHLERGLACYTPAHHQTYVVQYGFNPVIGCLLYRAVVLWLQGYPDQAARQIEHALDAMQELGHPFTQVFAHVVAAVGYQCLRQEHAVITQAEKGFTLARKHGLLFWEASSTVLAGWGQAASGKIEEGIQQMRTGLATMQKLEARVHRSHYLTLLAEAVGKTGDSAQALQLLEEVLIETNRGGERFYEAEAWHRKGKLLLAQKGNKRKARNSRLQPLASTRKRKREYADNSLRSKHR